MTDDGVERDPGRRRRAVAQLRRRGLGPPRLAPRGERARPPTVFTNHSTKLDTFRDAADTALANAITKWNAVQDGEVQPAIGHHRAPTTSRRSWTTPRRRRPVVDDAAAGPARPTPPTRSPRCQSQLTCARRRAEPSTGRRGRTCARTSASSARRRSAISTTSTSTRWRTRAGSTRSASRRSRSSSGCTRSPASKTSST